jgi:hypothetical protein
MTTIKREKQKTSQGGVAFHLENDGVQSIYSIFHHALDLASFFTLFLIHDFLDYLCLLRCFIWIHSLILFAGFGKRSAVYLKDSLQHLPSSPPLS